MTRRLCITNLSNWDGEDYEVTAGDDHNPAETKTIKPGESVSIYPHKGIGAVVVNAVESKTPEPFRNQDGAHVTPQMKVEFQ